MKRPFWQYGLFQIPAIFLAAFVLATGIAYLLNLGCGNFWVALFFGLSWIALAWALIIPLDILLRSVFKFPMSFAGRLSILHAVFWTVAISTILAATLPSMWNQCMALDWAQWRANIWNEMFYYDQNTSSAPVGSRAEFSFIVSDDGEISDINITTSTSNELESYVRARIESLQGSDALEFIPDTRRSEVLYESSITICEAGSRGCGEPADVRDYPDREVF